MVITDTVHVEILHKPGTWRELRAIAPSPGVRTLPTARWPTLSLVSSCDWVDFSLLNPFWKDQARAEIIHREEGMVDLKNPTASTLCRSSVLGLSKRGFLGRSPPSLTQGVGLCVHLVPSCSLATLGPMLCEHLLCLQHTLGPIRLH